jgi:2-amino-4-hydroxy-6-hydroxymethyldihydropteridine diphosphokinase
MITRRNATTQRVVIALGANLENPDRQLQLAARQLAALSAGQVKASSIWKTAPVGFSEAVPDFANAVMVIDSDLDARALLRALQSLEVGMGRERSAESGYVSRSIDLDIVDFGGQQERSSTLTLPHPRAHERLFVLLPLQEVLPAFQFPDRSLSLEYLIQRAPQMAVEKTIPLIP